MIIIYYIGLFAIKIKWVKCMSYRDKYFKYNKGSLLGRYKCSHCGRKFRKKYIDIDHIVPRSRGGTNDLSNLQALCRYCNRSKGNNTDETKSDIRALRRKNGGRDGYGTDEVYIPKVTDKFCFNCYKRISVFFSVELDGSGILCRDCYRLACKAYKRKHFYIGTNMRGRLDPYNKGEIKALIRQYKSR